MDIGPVIIDVQSTHVSSEEAELIAHPLCGGVILFSRNYESRAQVSHLVETIKQIKPGALIMVDQEGGRVQRFKEGFSKLPSLGLLGQLYDKDPSSIDELKQYSFDLGRLMAMEILSIGVDMSLAPVLDLNKGLNEVIGERAFHRDGDVVIPLAKAYIEGMGSVGMAATIKHFPGHGAVKVDSHHELPFDDRACDDIVNDMYPFKALANEANAKALMPAHIIYTSFDEMPAGFSPYWLKEVIRKDLGYQGVIISDDLSMEAAVSVGSFSERASKAIQAGCDLILVCNHRQGSEEVLGTLSWKKDIQWSERVESLRAHSDVPSDLSQHGPWRQAQERLTQFNGLCMSLNPATV